MTALDYLPVKLRVSPVYKISADFLPAGFSEQIAVYFPDFLRGWGIFSPNTSSSASYIGEFSTN
jgi:hypothetical protein